jgi:hypothetical protein
MSTTTEPAATGDPLGDDETAARALCRSLIITAEALMEVIDAETALLEDGHPHAIEALQSDKVELSARYLCDMTQLKRHADLIRERAADEVEALKPVMQSLGAKLLANRDALDHVLSVSERLIRTAAMTAIAARDGPTTYGPGGVVTAPPALKAAPVAINRAL